MEALKEILRDGFEITLLEKNAKMIITAKKRHHFIKISTNSLETSINLLHNSVKNACLVIEIEDFISEQNQCGKTVQEADIIEKFDLNPFADADLELIGGILEQTDQSVASDIHDYFDEAAA